MNGQKPSVVGQFEAQHASLKNYLFGFISCIVLTLIAYGVAVKDSVDDRVAVAVVAGLAIIQCVIQLQRFLHLGQEYRPRWKLTVFTIMLVTVLIIVFGSLWIMSHLNYSVMQSPEQTNEYVEGQDGL